jgi:hypothetical protein
MFLFQGINDNVRRGKNWTLTNNNTIELNSVKKMNNKSQPIESSLTTINHPKLEHENLNNKKVDLVSTTTTTNNNDGHRTVLARYIFHANVKQTFTRWIRETPV